MSRFPRFFSAALLLLCCLTIAPSASAFQASTPLKFTTNKVMTTTTSDASTESRIALGAKKKSVTPEPEREKNDGLGLFFLYMTPWKNPNSIFVYMLAGLYFLGKYSEAQSIARQAAGM